MRTRQVEVDGQALALPEDIEGILVLNIPSYMGGVNLWASGGPRGGAGADYAGGAPQSFCDGMLEARARKPSQNPLLANLPLVVQRSAGHGPCSWGAAGGAMHVPPRHVLCNFTCMQPAAQQGSAVRHHTLVHGGLRRAVLMPGVRRVRQLAPGPAAGGPLARGAPGAVPRLPHPAGAGAAGAGRRRALAAAALHARHCAQGPGAASCTAPIPLKPVACSLHACHAMSHA